MSYVSDNRHQLMCLFSEICSAREMELIIESKKTDESFDKMCSLDAILTHKYFAGNLEFPIDRSVSSKEDEDLAEELYSLVLCEEGVKKGFLHRKDDRYAPKPGKRLGKKGAKKYGRFLASPDKI